MKAPQQSQARKDALVEYIRRLRHELNLNHWDITIVWEQPERCEEGIEAEIEPMGQRHKAQVYLGDDFWEADRAGVRRILVHELLHLHHADVFRLINADEPEPIMRQALGAVTFSMFSANVKRELELMVDALTNTFAEFLSLPPKWPK